jgi:hypothetical protein
MVILGLGYASVVLIMVLRTSKILWEMNEHYYLLYLSSSRVDIMQPPLWPYSLG